VRRRLVTRASPSEPETEPHAPTREQLVRVVGALEAQCPRVAQQRAALKALVEPLQE
jgi:hypothetical protein